MSARVCFDARHDPEIGFGRMFEREALGLSEAEACVLRSGLRARDGIRKQSVVAHRNQLAQRASPRLTFSRHPQTVTHKTLYI